MAYFEIQKIQKEVELFKNLYIELKGKSRKVFLKEEKELEEYLKKISTFIWQDHWNYLMKNQYL